MTYGQTNFQGSFAALLKTKMNKEPYMTFLSKEEIIKHIEYLQTLDMPEVEKRGMISNWERCLKQNKDE